MTTKADICNLALGYAKQDSTISNFTTDTSTAGKRCRRFYEISKRRVLAMFNWNAAKEFVYLATKEIDSVEGYEYVYAYPSTCLRLVSVSPPGLNSNELLPGNDYAIVKSADGKTKEIHTNIEQAKAEIVSDNVAENNFDPMLESLVAAELSLHIGRLAKLKSADLNDVKENYAFILGQATDLHASEEKRTVTSENHYVEDRGS